MTDTPPPVAEQPDVVAARAYLAAVRVSRTRCAYSLAYLLSLVTGAGLRYLTADTMPTWIWVFSVSLVFVMLWWTLRGFARRTARLERFLAAVSYEDLVRYSSPVLVAEHVDNRARQLENRPRP